jgi:hypothetical protein
MAVTQAQLQQLYLAYFGRPADFDGIAFYTSKPDITIWDVAASFSASPESQSLFGTTFNAAAINAIYQNLFNRDAEPAGLLYWSQEVASGRLSPAGAALGILLGAQNADLVSVNNKLAIGALFTSHLDTAPEILAYTGDAAAASARAFLHTVTSDPATVTTATAGVDAAILNVVAVGGATGVTFSLTDGIDSFVATNATLVDTVKGVVDGADSTFTVGDEIDGNGLTVVQIIAQDNSWAAVEMSDIKRVEIIGGVAVTGTLNASNWTNVANVTLKGADGSNVTVDGLNNDAAAIGLKLDGSTTGQLHVTNSGIGTLEITGYIDNNKDNATGVIATIGTAGIDITVGKSGYASLSLTQEATGLGNGVAATVGNLSFAHINLNAATNASVSELEISNYASASAAAATVGNVSLGNVNLNGASGANVELTVTNSAYVTGKGAATAGSITIGTVSLTAATGAEASFFLYNSASADTGAAKVGDITVGDISLDGVGDRSFSMSNYAYVQVAGAATAGNITLGNVAVNGGSSDSAYLYVSNYVSTAKGAATVGNVTIGTIDSTTGYYFSMTVTNYAYASAGGAAKAGDITVGAVNLVATTTGSNYLYFTNYAQANGAGGNATVGNVTIGDVSMAVATSTNSLSVYNSAYAYGTATSRVATRGNTTIGNVTMNMLAADSGGTNSLYVSGNAYAQKGTATGGDLTVGDISINVPGITQVNANNSVTLYNYANVGVGAATVGDITVGNVSAKTGIQGYINFEVSNWASGSTSVNAGTVTVGNVAMQASKSASMYMIVNNYAGGAGSGSAAGLTVGNVSLVGDATAGTVELSISQWAQAGDVGSVTVGDVNLSAFNLHFEMSNSGANVGNTKVGNVTLKGNETGSGYIYQSATLAAGTVTVGNVSLTAGNAQAQNLNVSNYAGTTIGAMTLGNITLAMSSKDTGSGADAQFSAYTDGGKSTGGNITAGNITIGTSGITTKAALGQVMTGYVSLTSVDGTVAVGNITVTGGVKDTVAVVDNLATLSNWLTLDGSTVTVGNVDYSGYAAASTIDVSGYAGAATISSSKGGSAITDNKATNDIVLSANTTKADALYFLDAQTAVKDSGGVVTAAQASLDSVVGFAAGDSLHIMDTATLVVEGIAGDGDLIQNTPAQTYAQFLLNAEAQITSAGNSAYVATIDGNTYVAMNVAGKVGQIVEVAGTHTFTIAADSAGYMLTFLS